MTTIAETYIDAVNRGDIDALTTLFDHNAVLGHPSGTYRGVEEIATFYTSVVFAGQAVTEIEHLYVVDNVQILQLRASSPLDTSGRYVRAVDVFTLHDGRITKLEIYYR